MIDVHCHLTAPHFKHNLNEVILAAKQVGVNLVISCAEKVSESQQLLDLSARYPDFIKIGVGVHPAQYRNGQLYSVKKEDVIGLEEVLQQHSSSITCIGEVGLDFSDKIIDLDRETQYYVLGQQIKLALRFDKPLNVHSRGANLQTVSFLVQQGARMVLLHGFGDDVTAIQLAIKSGYYIAIAAKRTKQRENLISLVPLELMCLETDSPCISPIPFVTNEPKNLILSAKMIAEIKQISLEEVIKTTTENAKKLFRI